MTPTQALEAPFVELKSNGGMAYGDDVIFLANDWMVSRRVCVCVCVGARERVRERERERERKRERQYVIEVRERCILLRRVTSEKRLNKVSQ